MILTYLGIFHSDESVIQATAWKVAINDYEANNNPEHCVANKRNPMQLELLQKAFH